jgi:hypothetical protein
MSNVDLARWQFAFVTINHFLFVPVTTGLAFLTALLQTAWHRSKNDEYLRLTRFFGAPLAMEPDRVGPRPSATTRGTKPSNASIPGRGSA